MTVFINHHFFSEQKGELKQKQISISIGTRCAGKTADKGQADEMQISHEIWPKGIRERCKLLQETLSI